MKKAFTIVELLVVIVVIGILAAITIVAYTGISQKAVVASIQSDLNSASNTLKLYQVDNMAYPNSISDCPSPSTGNICLKISPGNTVSSYSANNTTSPQTYNLAIANGSNIYQITSNTQPTVLAPAPLSPVADWLATTQGNHYGNYYDLVTNQWATVTRSTPKTIYDPTTNHIYDVPAGKLGINPRSDGKPGSEAVIEEGRTNYLLNSSFSADTNSDGLSDNWTKQSTSQFIYSRNTNSSINGTVQKFRADYNSSGTQYPAFYQRSAAATFAAGDTATATIWYRNLSKSGASNVSLNLHAMNGSTDLGQISVALTVSTDGVWRKATAVYSNMPTNTISAELDIIQSQSAAGNYFEGEFAAAQIEKGAFATSYIPTTTTTITRNADVVTVPTTNWNASTGTITSVAEPGTLGRYVSWIGAANYVSLYRAAGSQIQGVIGGTPSYSASKNGTFVSTAAMSWVNGGSLYGYMDGVPSAATTGVATSALSANANVGGYAGYDYINGPMQRVVIYSSALSSSDVSTVTSAIQNGP